MDYEFNPGTDEFIAWDSFTLNDEKQAKKRFSKFFMAAFVFLLVGTLAVNGIQLLLLALGGESMEALLNSRTEVLLLINAVGLYAIAFPIMYLMVKKEKYVPRAKTKLSMKQFFGLLFVAEALSYVGNFVGTFLSEIISIIVGAENSNDVSELVMKTPIPAIILFVVVIGPIVEELIFRKLLMDRLGAYGDKTAIIVSAVAFGLFHGNLYQLFYSIIIGLILAYVYSKTGNVIYPIIMHAIFNFLGSVLPMLVMDHMNVVMEIMPEIQDGTLTDLTEYMRSLTIYSLYSIFVFVMLFVGIYLFFKYRRTVFVSDRCEVLIPKEKRASVILGNAGAICFLVICSITIILDIISPLLTNL